jgi:lysyl-tRNA synthetase class II
LVGCFVLLLVIIGLRATLATRLHPGAILAQTGIDVLALKTHDELVHAIRARKLPVETKPSWAKQVDELFSEIIQPTLIQPTFIVDSNT